ncbi:MAG: phage major capsid protein [Candidatus Thorarchaeota archaeon]|jgi:hypothetical protein
MRNRIFSDYGLINTSNPEGRAKMIGAITHFLQQPEEVQKKLFAAGVTNFTNTDDFANEVRVLIDKWHLGLEEIDNGWASFFTSRDFSSTRAPGFRVREVSSGLTFTKRPEGGRARIYSITGTEAFVPFDTYGGGLEFDQAWFEDQEWWLVEDTAAEFRSDWYRDKATIMYGLIGAIGAGYNVAYDTGGATVLEKDINTLNTAAAALLTAFKALGFNVTANTALKVLSPIQLRGRLQRALKAQYITPATAGAHLMVEYNITPIYSMNVLNAGAAATDIWYMGIPGFKNKIGEKMPLTVFSEFKAEAFATTTVGWGRYGAYLYPEQFRRLATA